MSPTPRITREPLTVIAELRFDPRHREAILDLAQKHVRNTLAAERDCLRFELVVPKDEPGVLVFSEVFASEAAFAAHRQSAHSMWFREARAPYGVEATVRELRPVAPAWPGAVLCATPVLAANRALLAPLTDAGIEIRWNERGRALSEAELIEQLDGAVAVVAGGGGCTQRGVAPAPPPQGRGRA